MTHPQVRGDGLQSSYACLSPRTCARSLGRQEPPVLALPRRGLYSAQRRCPFAHCSTRPVGASRQPQHKRCSGTWFSSRMVTAVVSELAARVAVARAVVVCVRRRHGTEHGNLAPPPILSTATATVAHSEFRWIALSFSWTSRPRPNPENITDLIPGNTPTGTESQALTPAATTHRAGPVRAACNPLQGAEVVTTKRDGAE